MNQLNQEIAAIRTQLSIYEDVKKQLNYELLLTHMDPNRRHEINEQLHSIHTRQRMLEHDLINKLKSV